MRAIQHLQHFLKCAQESGVFWAKRLEERKTDVAEAEERLADIGDEVTSLQEAIAKLSLAEQPENV
jgi:hypothetical protein